MQMSLRLIWLLQLISKARKKKIPLHFWISSYFRSGKLPLVGAGVKSSNELSDSKWVMTPNMSSPCLSFQDGELGPEARLYLSHLWHASSCVKAKVTLCCLSNLAAMLGRVIPTSIFSLVNYFNPKVQLHLITAQLTFVSATGPYKCESSEFNNYQRKTKILGNCTWH